MKIKNYFLSFSFFLAVTGVTFAQTASQRKNIVKDYNIQKLESLSASHAVMYNKQHKAAMDYAKDHNIPTEITGEDGEKSYLHHMDANGNLIYYKNFSIPGAQTIGVQRLWGGGNMGLELEGDSMIGAVWDGGLARSTHELLDGKVTEKDNSQNYHNHATHVAGIMLGKKLEGGGNQSMARGMANKADLHSYDWYNDISEMIDAAADGLLVSNHSYGTDLHEVNPEFIVGRYDDKSKAADELIYYSPYYTVVTAAGNDRGFMNPNPADGGYNLLGGEFSTSKNTIVVGAVNQVLNYMGPQSVIMTTFSSWGPTIDNRVKPDLVANGFNVLSSYAFTPNGQPSDDAYASENGTSMAAPSVAGGILLMQELSADLNDGEFLSSAMVRALLIATARQADPELGPNPRSGWGLMAADLAVELMLDADNGDGSFYEEATLKNSTPKTYTRKIQALEEDLKVTIAWTDVPGSVVYELDPPPVLVNDLDLRVTDSQGNVHYPWRLNPAGNDLAALRDGDNSVDNVEQVHISNAVPGETYTIEVSFKGSLVTGRQNFAIVSKGAQTLGTDSFERPEFSIYPNPAKNYVNISFSQVQNNVAVEIYDINGRKVLTDEFKGQSDLKQKLDISSLNSGVYFVKINSNGKSATEKLIIK